MTRRQFYQSVYRAFLRSPEWAAKRELVKQLNREQHSGNLICARCSHECEQNAVCHHKHYHGTSSNPGRWLPCWNCDPQFLEILCDTCHRITHGRYVSYDPLNPPPAIAELEEKVNQICALGTKKVQS